MDRYKLNVYVGEEFEISQPVLEEEYLSKSNV